MTKWEYKSFYKMFMSDEVTRLDWFNELGAEGWEIIEIKSAFNKDYTECSYFIVAKRARDV